MYALNSKSIICVSMIKNDFSIKKMKNNNQYAQKKREGKYSLSFRIYHRRKRCGRAPSLVGHKQSAEQLKTFMGTFL